MSKRKNKQVKQPSALRSPPPPVELPALPETGFLGGLKPNDILIYGDEYEDRFQDVVKVFTEKGKFIHVPNAIGVSYLRAY
jgi:hypothetical protein